MAKDYDPRMHTAEHVLNGVMNRLFGCGRCFSAHLNPGKSKCDYYFDREFTGDDARRLEDEVNAVLARNVPVTERHMTRREAGRLVSLAKLPDSVGPDDAIRIVTVGEYDICPCIGAHAASTAEVGAFRLLSSDFLPPKDGGSPVLRLRFRLDDPSPGGTAL